MQSIYIFSGLGADKRVFAKMDFSGFAVTFIDWITPLANEKIADYALRISQQIKSPNPILIGLSFGGIMTMEVAKILTASKIILIASAKTKYELPFYYRLAGFLGLHHLLPTKLLKQANFFSNWFFGAITSEDKRLLKEILEDTPPLFLKWAINQIVTWQNTVVPKTIVHIHGQADRILPIFFVRCDIKVANGGHFMTVNKAEELTRLIHKVLTDKS